MIFQPHPSQEAGSPLAILANWLALLALLALGIFAAPARAAAPEPESGSLMLRSGAAAKPVAAVREGFIELAASRRRHANRPALELAFAKKPTPGPLRQIVFITDGSLGNEGELVKVIHERIDAVRLPADAGELLPV